MPLVPEVLLLIGTGFVAGSLNAVAGGGSFLTLPALILVGLPPVTANATGTVALLPGYVSSVLGFREDTRSPVIMSFTTMVIVSLIGGGIGAGLLLLTPSQVFSALIPWLLLVATAAFAGSPFIFRLQRNAGYAGTNTSIVALFIVCIYGGYFNGGLGIILLALLTALGQTNLNAANGLKNMISASLTVVAVAIYIIGGAVSWLEIAVMILPTIGGGYIGARIVRRVREVYVRYAIVGIGLIMTALFFAY